MQIDMVQCTVRLNQKGNRDLTTIVKAGPDAISTCEMVLLRMQHDLPGFDEDGCCIGDAVVVGTIETTKQQEYERLLGKGFKTALIEAAFPQGRGMPQTLKEVDLPSSSLGKPLRKIEPEGAKTAEPPKADPSSPKSIAQRKQQIRDLLTAAGVAIPTGNLTEADLAAIAEENGLSLTEAA